MKYRPSINNVIVQVKTKYIKNFTNILRLAAIQQQSSIEPADYVNIVGTVVSLPKAIGGRREYQGFTAENIKVGDIAIFSSSVIYEFAQTEPEAEPIYKNSFWWEEQEYFVCDITRIYAVIRAGEIIMQNGYVMVEDIEKQSPIYLPQHIKKAIKTTKGVLTQIDYPLKNSKKIDCKRGDIVYFNPNIVVNHKIEGKEFGILQQKHILGKQM